MVSHFYGTEYEILAGLWPVGSTKSFGQLRAIFYVFMDKKNSLASPIQILHKIEVKET